MTYKVSSGTISLYSLTHDHVHTLLRPRRSANCLLDSCEPHTCAILSRHAPITMLPNSYAAHT